MWTTQTDGSERETTRNEKPCLTLALTLLPAVAAMGQVPLAEREALINLYEDTNGGGWTDSAGWLGPVGTECTWAGVTCLGEMTRGPAVPDHVTEIFLPGNQLAGTIPPELNQLDELNYLNLRSNLLQGPIPIELTDLGELTYLSLNANQLTGPIPEEVKRLTKLEQLILGNNELTGPLPLGLTELGSLTLVSLGGIR